MSFSNAPDDKKSVLHVLTSLDFGGVETQMRLIAKNATSSKSEHSFCALGRGGAVLNEMKALGSQATALGCKATIPSFVAIFSLWRYFRRVKPDVVHLHGAEANFHGVIAARLAGISTVICEENIS